MSCIPYKLAVKILVFIIVRSSSSPCPDLIRGMTSKDKYTAATAAPGLEPYTP